MYVSSLPFWNNWLSERAQRVESKSQHDVLSVCARIIILWHTNLNTARSREFGAKFSLSSALCYVREDVIIIIVCAGERGAHNKFLLLSCWCAHTAYLMMKFCLKPLVIYKLGMGLVFLAQCSWCWVCSSAAINCTLRSLARPPLYQAARASPANFAFASERGVFLCVCQSNLCGGCLRASENNTAPIPWEICIKSSPENQ